MDRRSFLAAIVVGTIAAPLAADAQPTSRMWRIGDVTSVSAFRNALTEQLADLGYINGRTIVLTHLAGPAKPAEVEQVLQGILSQVDLLVVWGTVAAVAAKRVIRDRDLPIVFLSVGNPVGIGLVNSLATPGGNMTGVTFEGSTETYPKRLQILKDVLPSLSRVAVLRAANDANVRPAMAAMDQAAPKLGVALEGFDVTSPDELEPAFDAMGRAHTQALLVIAGAFTFLNGRRIAQLALAHHLPSMHAFKETVADGGLVSLGPDIAAMARQGAAYVDKIIKGVRPADLPVEQPAVYEMHINLKTAKALGLTIPPSLLLRADEVIQ
jgi:putative ABC transport system substrate-binding protein